MSEKNVFTIFMEKMAADADFAAKVQALQTPAELIALAKTLDIALSEEQAQKGLEHVQKLAEAGGVLGDDALDSIAGGFHTFLDEDKVIEASEKNSSSCL